LYRNIVAQLRAQLLEFASGQVNHRDQAPVAVSGRNCDAIDRGGMTLGLLGALRRRRRDVKSPDGDSRASAYSAKGLQGGMTCHDPPHVGGGRDRCAIYGALIQPSDPVTLTATSERKTRTGLPSAVPT